MATDVKGSVLVVGGGIAGMMAAVAAARHGARTVIIDRFGHLGGNMGPGYFAGGSLHFALQNDQDITVRKGLGGMLEEFLRRIIYARPTADQMTAEDRAALERAHMNLEGLRVGTGGRGAKYSTDALATSHVAFHSGTREVGDVLVGDNIGQGHLFG